ncbi:restriction endonuclease subunit S [Phaeodactylibacter xiamenensis]|uniref:restriction endonuclease subunit S n=1 Tax=Phaeodactylibacter xiamenensis TaxID=1524460 RepID=UPI0024A81655|nr:restriction endonuclease subunit S [Phaeodactylibacter xiamenensis]
MKRYDTYKDSGIEWIGEIPEHWDTIKLKYTGESIIGIIYSPDDVVNEGEGILVLRASNIQDGKLAFEDCVYVGKQVQEKYLTKEGDILVCARNGSAHLVGKSAYIDKENEGLTFGAFMSVVRSDLDKYLFHFFNSPIFKAQTGLFSTSTINQLTSGTLNNMFISVPPDEKEQTAIAHYLDRKTAEIDALIADKKRLLQLYEEEKTAIINQAVTKGLDPDVPMKDSGIEWLGEVPAHWEVKRIKHTVSKVGSGVTPSGGASVYQLSGIPLLRSQNVHFDGLRLDDVAYITEEIHDNMSNSQVSHGDVLLNITGASIGRTYFVENWLGEANVNQHVCILRPKGNINTKYLYLLLRSNIGQEQIRQEQTGSGREGLNFEALRNFTIPTMDMQEQQSIVRHVEAECTVIDAKKVKTEKLIELLTEYRTALISEVVTGKIKVAD